MHSEPPQTTQKQILPVTTIPSYPIPSYRWSEALEFCNPVRHSGERGGHQEGTFDPLLNQVGNEGDALQGLSQAHLISKDTIHTIFIQGLH